MIQGKHPRPATRLRNDMETNRGAGVPPARGRRDGRTTIREFVDLLVLNGGAWSLWVVSLVVTMAMSGCGRSADTATLDRFQAAETEFAKAANEDQFQSAAQLYQQVTDSGFVSGRSLYNQGNAYMKSDQRGRAIASYRLALRHLPREPKLVANLESALGKPLDQSTDRILLDYVFVWQRWLSYREKFQLTTFLLVTTLALLWYSHWHAHAAILRRAGIVSGVLCLIFAVSSALDWYRYEVQQRGVLVEQMTPRKGNSENYAPAFTKSLAEGTEFVVLERRGDWLRGTFGDNAEGWVPVDSAVVY